MKKILYHIALLLLCLGCADPVVETTNPDVTLNVTQQQSSFLFAGLPVLFNINTQVPASIDEWSFGDTNTSREISPYHTFNFPGTYRISALIDDRQFNIDSTIDIAPRLNLIGSKASTENGKFIFENHTGGYTVIHTSNTFSTADDWMVLSTSSTFDSLTSKKVPIGFYDKIYDAVLNKNGNITAISEYNLTELSRNGAILKAIPLDGWTQLQLTETLDGYLAAGWNGFLNVVRFDYNFEKLSQATLDVQRSGFVIRNFYLEPDGTIRIHYYQNVAGENPSRVFVKIDIEGNLLLEKNYSSDIAPGWSSRLSSGYMLYGANYPISGGNAQLVFSRTDENGNVLWMVSSPQENMSPMVTEIGDVVFIEDGSSVIIFFDNQKGMKVNASGEIEWLKRFGLSMDTFNAATRNSKGNIVLLGSHQFDYVNFMYTTEYQKRDLVFLEIDTNGNPVP